MIIRWVGAKKLPIDDDLLELLSNLRDAVSEKVDPDYLPEIVVDDGRAYLLLHDTLDYVFYYAALALHKANSPDDEVVIDVPDLFVALAVRGVLRVVGIHAKIRIRPEGGTKREDLWRARDRLSLLSSLAFYD